MNDAKQSFIGRFVVGRNCGFSDVSALAGAGATDITVTHCRTTDERGKLAQNGGCTLISFAVDGVGALNGSAQCHPKDQYNKKLGITIAIEMALGIYDPKRFWAIRKHNEEARQDQRKIGRKLQGDRLRIENRKRNRAIIAAAEKLCEGWLNRKTDECIDLIQELSNAVDMNRNPHS